MNIPLAEKMRPKSLDEYIGQEHLVRPSGALTAILKSGNLPSMILWGPPGTGKTTLARLLATQKERPFYQLSAINSGVKDIGNANPTALVLASNTFQAVNVLGFPEARIPLSQCAIYLTCSEKSNSAYIAINEAQQKVEETGDLAVPLALRYAPTKLMKELGHGKEYQYAHDNLNNFAKMEFLPKEIQGQQFYQPGENAKESQLRRFLKTRWVGKYNY